MEPLPRHRPPTDRLTLVQAVRDVFAQSPADGDAVISDPRVGPGGAVILDLRIGQETAFRVVAPTEDEAYAVLCELVDSWIDSAPGAGQRPLRPPSAVTGREERCPPERPAGVPPPVFRARAAATAPAPADPPPASEELGSAMGRQPALVAALPPAREKEDPVSRSHRLGRDGRGSVQRFRCGQCRSEVLATARHAAPFWLIGSEWAVLCCGKPFCPQELGQVPFAAPPRRRRVRCPRCGYSIWVVVQPMSAAVCAGCQAECARGAPDPTAPLRLSRIGQGEH